jgi:hypothetical protein
MSRARPLILPLVVVAILAVPGSSTAAAASVTHCSGSVSKGFFTHITAVKVTCPDAKSLIKKWIKKSGFGHVDPPPSVTVGAFTCKNRFESSGGEATKLTCTASGGRKVTTVGSP